MRSLSCGETPLKSAFVNFISEREKEHWCSKGSKILSLHMIGTNGLSYLRREAQSDFSTSAVGTFSL